MKRPAFGHLLGYTALTIILTAGAAQSLAGSNTVTSDDIVDGTITHADVKPNSLGGSRFLDNSVTSSKILNNTVTGADINEGTLALPGAVKTTAIRIDGTKAFGAGTTSRPGTGQYTVDYGSSLSNCTAQATIGSNFNNGGESVAFGTKVPLAFPGYPTDNVMTIWVEDGVDGYTNAPMFVTLACAAGSAGHTTAGLTSSQKDAPEHPVSP